MMKLKIKGHVVIQPFFYDYLIVQSDKDEGLGYRAYRIYDTVRGEFVHHHNKNRGAIYGRTIDDVVKEFKVENIRSDEMKKKSLKG